MPWPLIAAAVGTAISAIAAARANKKQKENQMALMGAQQNKEMEMWRNTNYAPQIGEMKKAGLNPAMMYGMSGGGATTTGTGTVPTPATRGWEVDPAIGLQLDNIAADSELKRAQAKKLGGVDTEKTITETQGLEIQNAISKINKEIAEETKDWQKQAIGSETDIKRYMSDKEYDEMLIRRSTRNTEIQQKAQEYINSKLTGAATKAGIELTEEQKKSIPVALAQKWKELTIAAQNANTQEGRLELEKKIKDVSDSLKLTVEQSVRLIDALIPF